VTTFYSALKAELGRLERAELAERGRVDEGNWRAQLDALHAQHGSWKAVAADLGTDKRTLERWRLGYVPRGGGPRKMVAPAGFIPKIKAAVARTLPKAGNRGRQVKQVDWRKLRVKGTIVFPPKKPVYERTENMHLGLYFPPDTMAALASVYTAGAVARMGRAIDKAISDEYLGFAAHLADVEELSF
jgi:hypothetical protein